MENKDTTTLLKYKRAYGNKLIGLWLYEAVCDIDTEQWKVTKTNIEKTAHVLRDVCNQLADNDTEIATHYYRAYLDYLDKKMNKILDELD